MGKYVISAHIREFMQVDEAGYRLNIGMVLASEDAKLLWARCIGRDAWQFPQGGLAEGESPSQALFRELFEEVGLTADDVEILAETQSWLHYELPPQFIRQRASERIIGQKQKWFLLKLKAEPSRINLSTTVTPEFDDWRWVDYWHPLEEVIYFKRDVYQAVLTEFEPILLPS